MPTSRNEGKKQQRDGGTLRFWKCDDITMRKKKLTVPIFAYRFLQHVGYYSSFSSQTTGDVLMPFAKKTMVKKERYKQAVGLAKGSVSERSCTKR